MSALRRHVIISGTGRAGTTLLVQICTALGLDTGFATPFDAIHESCNAGMEKNLSHPDAPYIVKSTHLCVQLDAMLRDDPTLFIDRAIVCVRDLRSCAESRRDVVRRNPDDNPTLTPGGLWGTDDPNAQEDVLAHFSHQLLVTLAEHEIPLTLIRFPRYVHDRAYRIRRLQDVFPWLRERAIDDACAQVIRPELVRF
jgi:hypothetical protein